jgi:homoserine O-succinyltransferase/O-acetyltransferase
MTSALTVGPRALGPRLSAFAGESRASLRSSADSRESIVVGLVNNMPDSGLRSTERQFRELLATAAKGRAIVLRLFSLPEIRRGEAGQAYVRDHHEPIDRLWTGDIDGLIVTGTEPQTASLLDEPIWPSLVNLISWAQANTISTVWSCLAAHAACLCLDSVSRQQLSKKLTGVFDCRKVDNHALVADTPIHWRIPHSRYNELSEAALAARGYRILAVSREAGVDMFIRPGRSLFVFFQGHPEYDAGALAREYRRDVNRFADGTAPDYPPLPRHYFDAPAEAMLARLRDRLMVSTAADRPTLLSALQSMTDLHSDWHTPAVQIYVNWLSYLARHKPVSLVPEYTSAALVGGDR